MTVRYHSREGRLWPEYLCQRDGIEHARERQREQDRKVLSEPQRAAILALAADFPALWRDPNTPDRERKRMIRLLLEDITLLRGEHITLHIRFKGGATKSLSLPLPRNSWQQRQTSPDVVKEIDKLLDHYTYPQIAAILNERGLRSGEGKAFTSRFIARIQRSYSLMPRYDRLRKAGMLTVEEMAAVLGICRQQVTIWNRHGLIRGHAYNDKNDCLYEPPGENPPRKAQGIKLSQRALSKVVSQRIEEVQCEA
jgi:hypothetical protein